MARSTFHNLLHKYTEKLGIEIKLSTLVTDYFETDEHAGIVLEDGSKLTADIVVAADGIGSKSWNLVSGYKEKAISSGFALFRTTYPVERALQNPIVAERYKELGERAELYIGPGAHMIAAKSEKEMVFMLTHKV